MRKTINERLIELRKEQGLSLDEMAKLAGVTNATLCQMEKHSKSPSLQSIIRYVNAIGYEMEVNFVKKGEECEDLTIYVKPDLRGINKKEK